MFMVTESDAAGIRAAYEQEGELSAAIELRRLFPGIADNAKARAHVRAIAGSASAAAGDGGSAADWAMIAAARITRRCSRARLPPSRSLLCFSCQRRAKCRSWLGNLRG
jgi:hypothetical protein